MSGAISFGIGEITQGLGVITKAAMQAGLHGMKSGLMSAIEGGDFGSGFLAGAVSSLVSSGVDALGTNYSGAGAYRGTNGEFSKNAFGSSSGFKAVMIASGGLSGGLSSAIAGGNFWSGVREGLITAGLNHAMNHLVDKTSDTRKKIIKNARAKEGISDYAYKTEIDNFGEDTNKCNKYVYDVLEESGASPGTPNGNSLKKAVGLGSPPTAGDWANPDFNIPNWDVVSTPQAGDVVAYAHQYSNATGHVAIMLSDKLSIGANKTTVRVTDFGSNPSRLPAGATYVYRRYTAPVTRLYTSPQFPTGPKY